MAGKHAFFFGTNQSLKTTVTFFFTTKMSPIQMNPKLTYIHLPYNLPKLVIYLFQDNPQKRKVESSTILDINISVHDLHQRIKQQKTAGVDNPFLQGFKQPEILTFGVDFPYIQTPAEKVCGMEILPSCHDCFRRNRN